MASKCIEYLEMAMEELDKEDSPEVEAHKEILQGLIDDVKSDYDEESSNGMNQEEKDMEQSGNYEKGKHSGLMIEIKHVGSKGK